MTTLYNPERFSKFSSPCLHFYNLPERFFKFSSPCLQLYNPPERFVTFPPHVLHSQVYQRFFQVFSSPQLYILQPTKRSTFPLHNSTFHQETLGLSHISTLQNLQ